MKRVRLTLRGPALEDHPVFGPLIDSSLVDRVETLNWNVDDDGRATVLVRIDGDGAALLETLESVEPIDDVSLRPLDDESALAFVRDGGTDVSRKILRTFTRDGLLVVPPVVYEASSASVTVVGEPSVVQTAVDDLPDGVTVDVREIGDPTRVADPTSVLTDRQLEAARVGLEAGYFDVPRTASHEDVAAELECAPSTAAEHLQRAQSKLVRASLSSG